MMPRKILAKALASPANLRFGDLQRLVEAFGFQLLRVSGSHHIYGRAGLVEQVNLQEVGGRAKPYQIRQFLKLVERYNLRLEDS
jgi:hypothetical protein